MDLWTFQKSCLKDLDTFRIERRHCHQSEAETARALLVLAAEE